MMSNEPNQNNHFPKRTRSYLVLFSLQRLFLAPVSPSYHKMEPNYFSGNNMTLHSLFQSEDKDYWEAFGHYTSDNLGTVTVSEHASVGGTYEGTESMGLLWSMKPVPVSPTGLRFRKMNVLTPMVIHISVYSGHITEGFNKLSPLVNVAIERWYLARGVRHQRR
ncbi:hypothetical protein DPEC_G00109730 [Dallia pectoralis]|uniref:Uncharacterized protein n=1 Tax=Dallia pectoralis TaxID=75939 RepID=A0ACC2GSL2_DALPE|nr:hypothetical protein DPEC_G00109730 [Dallia pectoralis]